MSPPKKRWFQSSLRESMALPFEGAAMLFGFKLGNPEEAPLFVFFSWLKGNPEGTRFSFFFFFCGGGGQQPGKLDPQLGQTLPPLAGAGGRHRAALRGDGGGEAAHRRLCAGDLPGGSARIERAPSIRNCETRHLGMGLSFLGRWVPLA